MSSIKMYLFGSKEVKCKTRAIARTMTAGTAIAKLPKGSRVIACVLTGTASDAGTTATVSLGTTATATEWVTGYDVKTAANGQGPSLLPSNGAAKFGNVLTADTVVYAIYGETGGASAAGSWNVHIVYTDGETTR
jgi:hypothetical protein